MNTAVMNTVDIIVADIQASIEFYRRLGLEFAIDPSYAEHAGCDLPNGLHLMFDAQRERAYASVRQWFADNADKIKSHM